MVSLFCILSLALLVLFGVKFVKALKEGMEYDEGPTGFYLVMVIIFGILSAVFLGWIFCLINTVGTGATIDKKIAMYEEENTSIEENIDVIVRSYMNFEASTYGQLKDKDAINLVSLFPELKSDTLVQQQINVYVSNNNKIKTLKEEKIDLSKEKWKLYFGR